MVIVLPKQKIGKLKSQLTLKKAFITLLFVVMGATVFAQGTGKIAGTVTDKKTGEALIGAGVKIAGTVKAVGTDSLGRYILTGLAAGKYIIEVSYVSYTSKSITDIEVKDGATTNVNVILDEAGSTLNQVVIKGQVNRETETALLSSQKNAAEIKQGIGN